MGRIYAITALPKLALDAPLELSRHELDLLLEQNLSFVDIQYVHQIRSLYDILNIVAWLSKRPLRYVGSMSQVELQAALEQEEYTQFPKIVQQFFDLFTEPQDRKKYAEHILLLSFLSSNLGIQPYSQKELAVLFDKDAKKNLHPTVRAIFEIEHTFRCILSSFRSHESANFVTSDSDAANTIRVYDEKKQNYNDSFIDAMHTWPNQYEELAHIWQTTHTNPQELEKATSEWKFKALSSLVSPLDHFGLNILLVYCAQFDLIESRSMMNTVSCNSVIERISKARHNT